VLSEFGVLIVAYHVSGEYAMLKAAARAIGGSDEAWRQLRQDDEIPRFRVSAL
jgi:delta-aminolevulinic acid dehydratase/porphobilinogen synthase